METPELVNMGAQKKGYCLLTSFAGFRQGRPEEVRGGHAACNVATAWQISVQ